jgi:RimJ/RimL family protein N-acetyltransferase
VADASAERLSQEYERAFAFLSNVATRRASAHREVVGGRGFLNTRFPAAHDHNFLLLWTPVDAERAAAAADELLGGAGLPHRLIEAHRSVADDLGQGLVGLGYRRSTNLIMTLGRDVALAPDTHATVELELDERARASTASWRSSAPSMPVEVCRQLGERVATITDAVDATFLAVRGDDGTVQSCADLYIRDDIAQVEGVVTEPDWRGRGMASALVSEAIRRAQRADARLIFLVADADGEAARLYRRLGFRDAGITASYTRGDWGG